MLHNSKLKIPSKLFLFFLFLSFLFLGLAVPKVTYADSWDWLANALAWPVYGLAWLLGELLSVIIYFLITVAQYNNFIDAEPVKQGWVIVRDLCNMFFVIVLLVIAFGTVLKIETYHYKRLLPKFLLMAILINFSKTIAGLFIDAAQIIMLTFVAGFSSIAGGNLVTALHIKDYLSFNPNAPDYSKNSLRTFGAAVLALITVTISLIVVVIITIVFVFRIIALWILVILSPLAYLLSIVPAGQKYASQWWQKFTSYVIVGPVLAFFLWLSLTTSVTVQDKIAQITPVGLGEKPTAIGTKIGTVENMGGFIIGICLLVGSLVAAAQIGVAGGKMAGDWAGRIQRGQVFPAPVQFAGRRFDMWRMKGGEALKRYGEGKDTFPGFLARGAGKAMLPQISMRPTVWKEALKQREARLQRRYYAEPTGTAQNILNRVLFSKDKTDYRWIRRGQVAAEDRKELMAEGYSTERMKMAAYDAWKHNDTMHFENALRELSDKTDLNELLSDPRTYNMVKKRVPKEVLDKFGVEKIGYNPQTLQAVTSHVLGKELGPRVASDLSYLEFLKGNFHFFGAADMDSKGKFAYTPYEDHVRFASSQVKTMELREIIRKTRYQVLFDQLPELDEKERPKGKFMDVAGKYGAKNQTINVVMNEKNQWQIAEGERTGQILAEEEQAKAKASIILSDLTPAGEQFLKDNVDEEFIKSLHYSKPQFYRTVYEQRDNLRTAAKRPIFTEADRAKIEGLIKRATALSVGEEKVKMTIQLAPELQDIANQKVNTFEDLTKKLEQGRSDPSDLSLTDTLEKELKALEENITQKLSRPDDQNILKEIKKNITNNIERVIDEGEFTDNERFNIMEQIKKLTQILRESSQASGGSQSGKSGKTIYDAYGRPVKEI